MILLHCLRVTLDHGTGLATTTDCTDGIQSTVLNYCHNIQALWKPHGNAWPKLPRLIVWPEREHVCPPTSIQPQLLTINKTSDENPTAMFEPLSSFWHELSSCIWLRNWGRLPDSVLPQCVNCDFHKNYKSACIKFLCLDVFACHGAPIRGGMYTW